MNVVRCFQIHPADNVATLLDDLPHPGPVELLGALTGQITAHEPVKLGHKLSLVRLSCGDAVIKFGVPIGHATQAVEPGQWVHLHNLASDHDERSNTLDLHSGAPTDMVYE